MNRTILIGLDGATFPVLDMLMADGVMPRLRDFVGNGARGELLSTPNPLTPPAWTSLVTGRTPGHHGIFDFVRASQGEKGLYFTLNAAYDIRCETIWSVVSRLGGTVSALNFPVSTPPPRVNGNIVPGFVPWRHLRRSVHPPEFYDFIKSLDGFDPKILSMDMVEELKSIQWLPPDEYETWIRHHAIREKQWFTIARAILAVRPTDLVAVLFDGMDKLQHLCWRQLDPDLRAEADSDHDREVREWCMQYFRELDGYIGEILDLAGPEARVFFASDHGFGPTRDVFYANVWLEREGYLAWAGDAPLDDGTRVARDRIKSHVEGIDWDRTKAFALTPSSNGIFIRRADGPGGSGVKPEEYEGFRRELASKLAGLTHPDTGDRFVKKVMTREEAFPGEASGEAPDLTLVLEDYGFLSVMNADSTIRRRPVAAGTHRPEGIFLAGGPGITGGKRIEPLSIVDVAPALIHSLGLPVPSDWEGRVPVECYESAFRMALPVRDGDPTLPPERAEEEVAQAPGEKMSGEDEAKVMARLQELGYIE